MNEVLAVILSMSLSGGIVIIVLHLVLLLFRKNLYRQWQYYIWLLLPFAPQQNLMNELFQSAKLPISAIENSSLEGLQNEQTPTEDFKINVIQSENAEDEKGNIQSSETNFETTDETVNKTTNKELSRKPHVVSDIFWQYLWLIWLLPAMVLLTRKIIIYEKTLQYIRAGNKEVQDIVLLEEFDKLMEKIMLRAG